MALVQLGMLGEKNTPISGMDWWKNPKIRGYAGTPGRGPQGETCQTCQYYVRLHYAKEYRKCVLMRKGWTGGYRTDILARAPACEKWDQRFGITSTLEEREPWQDTGRGAE